jgi:putative Holliday junction resolvase
LDVGHKRIGVARARSDVKLVSPLTTLDVSDNVLNELVRLCQQEDASQLVVGLPRNLQSEDTDQTRYVRQFADQAAAATGLPVAWQDEALTSVRAEEELQSRGKPYARADIDALAATYILDDYIKTVREF